MRIAINGFGRIGRLALRALYDRHPAIKVVAINDLADRSASAHLLRYDSNYGPSNHSIETTDGGIIVNGDRIQYLSIREWDKLPWGDLGTQIDCPPVSEDAPAGRLYRDTGCVTFAAPIAGRRQAKVVP